MELLGLVVIFLVVLFIFRPHIFLRQINISTNVIDTNDLHVVNSVNFQVVFDMLDTLSGNGGGEDHSRLMVKLQQFHL